MLNEDKRNRRCSRNKKINLIWIALWEWAIQLNYLLFLCCPREQSSNCFSFVKKRNAAVPAEGERARLVWSSLWICFRGYGPEANRSAEEKTNEDKQTSKGASEPQLNNEWSKLNLLERQFMNVMNEWSGEIDCLRNGKPREPSPAASQHFIQFNSSQLCGIEWMKWRREIGRRQLNGAQRAELPINNKQRSTTKSKKFDLWVGLFVFWLKIL